MLLLDPLMNGERQNVGVAIFGLLGWMHEFTSGIDASTYSYLLPASQLLYPLSGYYRHANSPLLR